MTRTAERFEGLRAWLTGTLVEPGDRHDDVVRTLWNGDVDHRPAVVACDAAGLPAQRDRVRAGHRHLPLGIRGEAYLNADTDPDAATLRASFGSKVEGLAAVRERYDPTGTFVPATRA